MERDVTLFPQAYSAEACYPHYYFHVGVQDFCRDLPLVKVADRSCKCVFVGDSAVGKTSLINRFVRNFFIKDYKLTIGVDFDVQSFNILGVPFHFQVSSSPMHRAKPPAEKPFVLVSVELPMSR